MAPGRSAERFLTTPARTASARALLALAVGAAFLFAGCGGGSSSDTSTSTAATDGAAASRGTDPATAGPNSADNGRANAPQAGSTAAAGGSGAAGGQPSAGKHGPSVPQPSGPEAPKITPQQRREATVANMILQSPSATGAAAAGAQALPAQYTCDGKNTSPALRWQGVPEGTAELVLFAMNIRPVEGKLFFDWAVAGLDPGLEEIPAGKLPKGAVLGRNGFGKAAYEICPEGSGENYIFTLFALPKALSPSQGFDPTALRKAVLGVSGSAGLLGLSYTRG